MKKLSLAIAIVVGSFAPAISNEALKHILMVEDLRIAKCQKLYKLADDSDPKIARAAILAMGRLADSRAVEPLKQILRKDNIDLKVAAATSLGLIATVDATTALLGELNDKTEKPVLIAALTALGNTGSKLAVPGIDRALKTFADEEAQEAGYHALGKLWGGNSEKWELPYNILNRAATAAKLHPSAAFALARFKGEDTTLDDKTLLATLEANPPVDAKVFLCRLLAKHPVASARKWVLQQAASPELSLAIECLKPLEKLSPDADTEKQILKSFEHANASVRVQALQVAGAMKSEKITAALGKLVDKDPSRWVKDEALKSLCRVNSDLCRPVVEKKLKEEPSHFLAAVESLSILGQPKDLEKLTALVTSTNLKIAAKAWESLASVPVDKLPPTVKELAGKALDSKDIAVLAAVTEGLTKWKFTEHKEKLQGLLLKLDSVTYFEVKVSIHGALKQMGVESPEMMAPITKTEFTLEEIEKAFKERSHALDDEGHD